MYVIQQYHPQLPSASGGKCVYDIIQKMQYKDDTKVAFPIYSI